MNISRNITIVIGHPDPSPARFARALAEAYSRGAREAGHAVQTIDIATLDFPLLRSQQEWKDSSVPAELLDAERAILWAEHLVLLYPLWLGDVPALFKGFLEQVLRPGRADAGAKETPFSRKLLSGKTARVVITMGMPAFVYRWVFGAHSLKSLKRNVLWFVGVSRIRDTLFGMIESGDRTRREKYLARMQALGRDGA